MSKKNIEYYDHIADKYNDIQINTSLHMKIREQVADLFKSIVKGGSVLDFGGGTGMDLPWLCEAGYQVFFYEPSQEMKKNAINAIEKYNLNQHVNIIDSVTDGKLKNNIGSVLANFAVLNSIQNISSTFEYFSKILEPKGTIFILVIDTRLNKLLLSKKYFIKTLFKIIFNKSLTTSISHNSIRHCVYLHFIKDYRNASEKWFEIKKITPLGGYGFLLIQFCRK
jgi:ubiquinone/menaquinone biosynthesis C-methylase UbiE